MSSIREPIKLWGQGSTNPPKVAMILEELHLAYEVIAFPMSDVKKPEFTAINPNGRLPAIQDPNTGITLWESGAIVEYLIETYDPDHSISFAQGTAEYYHAKQWLFFQVSGQGPYYGQAAWFTKFHHEKLPSALERYTQEVRRVTGVLESWLAKQKEVYPETNGPWLVGNKLSYADISFLQWQRVIPMIMTEEQYNIKDFPLLEAWIGKMMARKTVARALDRQPQMSS